MCCKTTKISYERYLLVRFENKTWEAWSQSAKKQAMPMLSALDRLEARGLPRWISLLGVEVETLDGLEQNDNEFSEDAVSDGTGTENMSLLSELDSVLEEASVDDRQMSLLSKIETELVGLIIEQTNIASSEDIDALCITESWSRRSAAVHSRTWCSSKVKHRARGLPTGQPTDPAEAWPNAIYTNSFATPFHSKTFPSNEPTRRNSWAGVTKFLRHSICEFHRSASK